jgi:HlyD family secretion protein
MKQAIIVVVAALALVVGGTFFVLTRDDMPNLLPELGPPVTAGPNAARPDAVVVSGRVVPLNSAELGFPTRGVVPEGAVSEVLVKEGDHVEQGAVLARIDARDLELGVEEAKAELAHAQALYDKLKAGATPLQVQQAQAQVAEAQAKARAAAAEVLPQDFAAAQAELDAARALVAQAQSGPNPSRLRAAQSDLEQARTKLQTERDRLSADKTKAQLLMEQAANNLRTRQDAYSRIHWENLGRGTDADQQNLDREAAALREMQDAEKALEQARVGYEQAQQAEVGGVAAAEAAVNGAQAALDELTSDADPASLAAARARLAHAEANMARLQGDQESGALAVATVEEQHAQSALELLSAGPDKLDLAAAAAQVQLAEIALKRSQLALELAALRAPFAGTIVNVNLKVGELPDATAPAFVVADLSAWQVVADDLSELDAVRVDTGTPVTVVFDALPGLELPGKLQRVAAIGTENFETRGATYMAYITLDRQDSRLRWNMSATVTTAPPAGNASGASPSTKSVAFEPGR